MYVHIYKINLEGKLSISLDVCNQNYSPLSLFFKRCYNYVGNVLKNSASGLSYQHFVEIPYSSASSHLLSQFSG